MASTPLGLPYPELISPNNPPADFKALAEALDALITQDRTSLEQIRQQLTSPQTHVLSLSNNWENYGSAFQTCKCHKTADGFVILQGLVRNGNVSRSITTLPVGWRPESSAMFFCLDGNGKMQRIDISPTGGISVNGTLSKFDSYISLDGIVFKAAA